MRTCAICGKRVTRRDVCNLCFKRWAVDGILPDWAEELIRLQKSFEREDKGVNQEITFSNDYQLERILNTK